MSVAIRLTRQGRTNLPFFRVQVIDKRFSAKSGLALEEIGTYCPTGEKEKFDIKQDRLKFWTDRGALISERVKKLIKTHIKPPK